MKINGRDNVGVYSDVFVIPRPDSQGGDIVFKLVALHDFIEFDALVPMPVPRVKIKPGGEREFDEKDKGYQAALTDYATQRVNYIFIKTIETTEGLEWSEVNLGVPGSWPKWRDELISFGLAATEINQLLNRCIEVNALNDKKLIEARERFLAGEAARLSESST